MNRYIFSAACVAFSVGLSAQDIQREITIDRTIQPVLREAVRLNGVTPNIITPQVSRRSLVAAEYTAPGKINNETAQLPPAPWRDSLEHSPYRGYASLGYFPLYNLGANAGYRFVDTDRFNAGAWMQYNGATYHGGLPAYDDAPLGHHYITLGANGTYRYNNRSALALDVEYMHASLVTPYLDVDNGFGIKDRYNQHANQFDSRLKWHSDNGTYCYKASAGWQYFGYRPNMPAGGRAFLQGPVLNAIPENLLLEYAGVTAPVVEKVIDIAGGFGITDGDTSNPWLGVDVDWTVVNTNWLPFKADNGEMLLRWSSSYTEGHINPYLMFGNDRTIFGRVGFNLSIATGNGNGHVRIAPDLAIDWRPVRIVTLYARATGGEHVNRTSSVFDINPYMSPYQSYERTNNAVQLDGGVTLGPISGFSMSLFGGYASTRNRLVPMITEADFMRMSTFTTYNVHSWRVGANARYQYRRLFKLEAGIESGGSPNDYTSWVDWNDGAHVVAHVGATVMPVEPLTVNVSYEQRTSRKAMLVGFPPHLLIPTDVISLGNIQDLSINANYKVTEAITAFIFVENLLNKRYMLISGMPAQGIKGLCGVAYKF